MHYFPVKQVLLGILILFLMCSFYIEVQAQNIRNIEIIPQQAKPLPSSEWLNIFESYDLSQEDALTNMYKFMQDNAWQVMFAIHMSSRESISRIKFWGFESFGVLDSEKYSSSDYRSVFCTIKYDTLFNRHPKTKITIYFTMITAPVRVDSIILEPGYLFPNAVFKFVIKRDDNGRLEAKALEVYNLNRIGYSHLKKLNQKLHSSNENLRNELVNAQTEINNLKKIIMEKDTTISSLDNERKKLRRPARWTTYVIAATGLASATFVILANNQYNDYLKSANEDRKYTQDKYTSYTHKRNWAIGLGGLTLASAFVFNVYPKPFQSHVLTPLDSLEVQP
jgi:hypothetical protein